MISFALLAVTVATSLAGGETVAFRGTLGDLPIRMSLTQHEGKIGGFYLYESRFVPIALDGTIQPSRRVRLADTEHPQRPEKFEGRISGSRFLGTWTSADGKKKQPFSLRQDGRPTAAPATWKRFRGPRWPVSFRIPAGWSPVADENGIVLAAVSRGFDDDLHASWGRMDRDPPRYRRQGEGWFFTDESGDHPIGGPVRRGALSISRNDLDCRIQSARGYEGMGSCASALVLGPDFWVVFQGSGPTYESALDVLLTTLRRTP